MSDEDPNEPTESADSPRPVEFYRDPQCRWKHRRNCKCRGEARKPIKLGSS